VSVDERALRELIWAWHTRARTLAALGRPQMTATANTLFACAEELSALLPQPEPAQQAEGTS
jgi:hypothetical protein